MALKFRAGLKINRSDTAGALSDYSAIIQLPGALPHSIAEAYYLRGLLKGRKNDRAGAITDLQSAIARPGAPGRLVAAAERALEKLKAEC